MQTTKEKPLILRPFRESDSWCGVWRYGRCSDLVDEGDEHDGLPLLQFAVQVRVELHGIELHDRRRVVYHQRLGEAKQDNQLSRDQRMLPNAKIF